jgi:glucose-1-phosphate adenylyltransferase
VESALAMILAGGRGKRMDILCHPRAKPALPFAGDTRVIDFTLSNCIHSQIGDIAVLTDYHRADMAHYINRWSMENGNSGNIQVLEPRKDSYQGTADAVYQNIEYLEKNSASLVLVLAGDHIYKMNYQAMLAFHRQIEADATVAVIPVPIEQAHRFGIVTIDSKVRVTGFVEKPEVPQSNLVSMGIYIFDKQVLIHRLIEDAALPHSPHDFGHAIMPSMVRRDKVAAYKFNGYWQDIGTTEAYYQANMELVVPKPAFSLNGGWSVLSAPNHLPPAKVLKHGSVENSLVSPGCVIKGRVKDSILMPGVCVEEEAVIMDSIVMSNTFIGYHSVVDHCILDEGVNVGKFCYLGFGSAAIPGNGVTVLGKEVTVPSHTAICRNCKILPHVGPGDFITRVIPTNSVLSPGRTSETLRIEEKGVLGNVRQGVLTP